MSGKINKLEQDLQLAREDLRSSRQTLLVEQERSNAMIRSVTNELERTRPTLMLPEQLPCHQGVIRYGLPLLSVSSMRREEHYRWHKWHQWTPPKNLT